MHFGDHDSGVLQNVIVCCSVLQCVAAYCSVLQRVAVCCCSVLQCVAVNLYDRDSGVLPICMCIRVFVCVCVCVCLYTCTLRDRDSGLFFVVQKFVIFRRFIQSSHT